MCIVLIYNLTFNYIFHDIQNLLCPFMQIEQKKRNAIKINQIPIMYLIHV
jgi:hypothetical protein